MDEQKHFEHCRHLIRQNISYYDEKVTKGKKETEALYAAVASGNVELYDQLVVSQDLLEHQERQLKKNHAALLKPYFGRIDYQETETGQTEQLYIGKNGISKNQTEIVIVDWRAPVSTLYYENELGDGCYEVPNVGRIPVELTLKRTFDVDHGKLLGYYDNDTAATDELLVKYLSQNKDAVLGDIISTIQKEQNEIIRQTPFINLIVQGVAGSGKTTVAMHRISYILYNYEKRFTPDEFCIIGNNDMLLNYITSGLPELDVYHISQKRMDVFFQDLLGNEWKKKYHLMEPYESEAFKTRVNFITELDCYLTKIRNSLLENVQVTDSDLGIILSADNIHRSLVENPTASMAWLYDLLNQRVKTKIRFMMSEDTPDSRKKKLKDYRQYFKLSSAHKNIVSIYENFLNFYGTNHSISTEQLAGHIKKGHFDVYDLAALVLIQKRMTEKKFHDEYSQIIIDEAQDFGPAIYYVLKQVLLQCYFTIMGDVSQNIYYRIGLNEWDALINSVFEPERTSFHILAKSYRNTIEISELAGHVLDLASCGRYKIQPVIRHGVPVAFHQMSPEQMAKRAVDLITEIRRRGYQTIAIICRNQEETSLVESQLKQYPDIIQENCLTENAFARGVMVLPIHLTKGLEFDSVLLWNPDQKSYGTREGDSKLLYVAITRALHELHILYSGELTTFLRESNVPQAD